jgi:anti-sigma B factor antagonist
MNLISTIEKDFYQITLSGDLDASSSILLDQEIEKAIYKHPKEIRINCNHLNYISSAGIGVLISHLKKLKTDRISLVMYDMNPSVRDLFEITRLHEFISILPAINKQIAYHDTINSSY